VPPPPPDGSEHALHLYTLRLRPGLLALDRNEFIKQLKKLGVGTSVHFIPLHRHSFYTRTNGYASEAFPSADDTFSRCISLPIYPDLTDAEIERVADAVQYVVTNNLKRITISAR